MSDTLKDSSMLGSIQHVNGNLPENFNAFETFMERF
jgi:hypothetical protein